MKKKQILSKIQLQKALEKIIKEIIKKNKNLGNIVIIGLQTRGVYIAKRIVEKIKTKKKINIPVGTIDITLYRDDVSSIRKKHPLVQHTDIPFNLVDKNIILVDDVLYTGRTIRAALNELMDFGRPQKIQLAVLVDRGDKELPIHADYIGKSLRAPKDKKIKVQMKEIDGKDEVLEI